jgi:hypothetical protein
VSKSLNFGPNFIPDADWIPARVDLDRRRLSRPVLEWILDLRAEPEYENPDLRNALEGAGWAMAQVFEAPVRGGVSEAFEELAPRDREADRPETIGELLRVANADAEHWRLRDKKRFLERARRVQKKANQSLEIFQETLENVAAYASISQ